MVEVIEGRKIASSEHDRPPTGTGAVRHDDRSIFTGRELLPTEPQRRAGRRLIGVVDDRNAQPSRPGRHERAQSSLSNQSPAALAAADKVNDVDAGLRQLWKIKSL